jgi:hypothetical protein
MSCSSRSDAGKHRDLRLLAVGLLTCASMVAHTPSPAEPVPVEAASLPAVRLLGVAQMRFLGMRIYEARLWVDDRFDPLHYDKGSLVLELRYARRFTGATIAERSLQEMRRAGRVSDAQAQAWLALMEKAFPDVQAGQRLTGVLHGGQVRFFHDGHPTAATDDPAFAQRFFGIWLAQWTSEPGLRAQLLGGAP